MPEIDRSDKLAEINVAEQVPQSCKLNHSAKCMERGQEVELHGIVYGIEDGKLEYLGVRCNSRETINDSYNKAMEKILNPEHQLLCR